MAKKLSPDFQAIISASDAQQHATTAELANRFLSDKKNDTTNLRVLLELGHANRQLSRFDESIAAFESAIEICDADKQDVIFGELGNLHRTLGQFDKASDYFQRQIAIDPNDATGFLFLGSMRLQLGQLAEAETALQDGLKCEIGCMEELHFTLGLVLRAQRKFDAAIIEFEKAVSLDVNFASAKAAVKDVKAARSAG